MQYSVNDGQRSAYRCHMYMHVHIFSVKKEKNYNYMTYKLILQVKRL